MKDLDFDELDRAVNSLMTNVPKTSTQPTEQAEKTLDITPTLSDDAVPSFDTIAKTAEKAASPSMTPAPKPASSSLPVPTRPAVSRDITPARLVPPAAPLRPQPSMAAPATRRGGKFMDVVRPATTKQEDALPVSRQGVTIQPSSNIVVEEQKPEAASQVPAVPEPETPAATAQAHVDAPTSDWPDPLDMQLASAPSKIEADTAPEAPEKASSEPEPVAEEPKVDTPQEPLTSPFLPDAKVEKRPLGSPTPPEVPQEAPETDAPSLNETPTEPSPETVSVPDSLPGLDDTPKAVEATKSPSDAVNAPLPEELSNDLMAVEADTTHDELRKEHDTTAEPEEPSQDKHATTVQPTVEKDRQDKEIPSGPTSIPQQYHEAPSTGDKDSGSIYDTSTYHQPLAHPKKKSSGRLIVLWVVVVLLLGIAAGAALYFSGII